MINVYIAKSLKGKTENLRNFEVSRISREYLRIKDKNAYVNPHTHKNTIKLARNTIVNDTK